LIAPGQPRHQVTLDAFYLDQYEITNRLFDKFVKATGYQTTQRRRGTRGHGLTARDGEKRMERRGGGRKPADGFFE